MLALLLIPLYALSDRFVGGGAPKLDDMLPGRSAFWAALACAAAGWFTLGGAGAFWALVWLVWRTPAWKVVPGASMTPDGSSEILATFARHAVIPLVGGLLVSTWFGWNLLWSLAPMGAFAVAATALAAWYGGEVRHAAKYGGDIESRNAFVELARGAAFGLAVAAGGLGGQP